MTLNALCAELKNYFVVDPSRDIVTGTFTVEEGSVTPEPPLKYGQYFRIVGSAFNDGVYQYKPSGMTGLKYETFDGAIWAMSIPTDVSTLLADISAWETETAAVRNSPYQSESFGGYNYSLKSGASVGGTGALTWQNVFADRLKPYRRLAVLI